MSWGRWQRFNHTTDGQTAAALAAWAASAACELSRLQHRPRSGSWPALSGLFATHCSSNGSRRHRRSAGQASSASHPGSDKHSNPAAASPSSDVALPAYQPHAPSALCLQLQVQRPGQPRRHRGRGRRRGRRGDQQEQQEGGHFFWNWIIIRCSRRVAAMISKSSKKVGGGWYLLGAD